MMIEGECHCGNVNWSFEGMPESATACNCTLCRRYGALWIYGYEGEGISHSGETQSYVRGDSLGVHFCATCGCVAYWRSLETDENNQRRMAVNLRLSQPGPVSDVSIRHFDGLDSFAELPGDGRCVVDYWF